MEVDAQLVSDRPCLSTETYILRWPRGIWRVILICTILDNVMGRIPMYGVGIVLMCGSRGPSLEGVSQDFEDRSLKTQTQLRFGDVGMAGPIYKP